MVAPHEDFTAKNATERRTGVQPRLHTEAAGGTGNSSSFVEVLPSLAVAGSSATMSHHSERTKTMVVIAQHSNDNM